MGIKDGEVFSFLCPSGAGKSTLKKIMFGLIRDYEGSMRVNDTESKKVKRSFYEDIGVMMEFPSVYLKLKGEGNLDFFSSLHKNRRDDFDQLIQTTELLND